MKEYLTAIFALVLTVLIVVSIFAMFGLGGGLFVRLFRWAAGI